MSSLGGPVATLAFSLSGLLLSGPFWAALGVLATIVAALIPLVVRSRSRAVRSTFVEEMSAQINTRFADVVEARVLKGSASTLEFIYRREKNNILEHMNSFKEARARNGLIATTREAYLD